MKDKEENQFQLKRLNNRGKKYKMQIRTYHFWWIYLCWKDFAIRN